MNQILYGVAGTGKTFQTKILAINCIENTNFDEFSSDNFQDDFAYIAQKYEYYTKENQIFFVTFHPNFSYQEFVEGITAQTSPTGEVHYTIKDGIFKIITQKAISKPKENFVLIIDEINRGNVAKIFGELITLIEPNKRLGKSDAHSVILPYSQESFGVPQNLHIIATMNTADRSIAPLDLALRRRFTFREILPNPSLLANKIIENIYLDKILQKINQRIVYFLGENYQIGHSYFLENCDNLEDLAEIFLRKIIPLLREYFFDDDQKVALILQNKSPNLSFFKKEIFNPKNLFFEKNNVFNDNFGGDFDDFFQEKIIYKPLSKQEIIKNPAVFEIY